MHRRTFLTQSALLSTAAFLPLASFSAQKKRYKLGLQLFSVNGDMNRDPLGTLKAVKAMGYEDFEIYGFDAAKLSYYGIEAGEFRKLLDELGLTVSSGHYGFSDYLQKPAAELKKFTDACIKGAKALDAAYITWPWIAPEQRTPDTFRLLAERLNSVGEQVKAAGLGFAYHNHGYEFDAMNDGQSGYDIILKETDASLVKLQMDMYWVLHAGKTTPAELIARNPGRYVMWHIKDMHKTSRDYTEMGNGSIDYTAILPGLDKSSLQYYYVEQGGNFAKSPLQSAADSAAYVKKSLQQYL